MDQWTPRLFKCLDRYEGLAIESRKESRKGEANSNFLSSQSLTWYYGYLKSSHSNSVVVVS